jgi:hypothetical protein
MPGMAGPPAWFNLLLLGIWRLIQYRAVLKAAQYIKGNQVRRRCGALPALMTGKSGAWGVGMSYVLELYSAMTPNWCWRISCKLALNSF